MNLLPMRPQHATGEHLTSLLERTAVANNISPRAFGLREATIAREHVDATVVDRLSRAVAVPARELATMTLDAYPAGAIGRRHRPAATHRTWRLPAVRWSCPRCTPATGIYDRDWQLALHPLCTRCPALLRVHGDGDRPLVAPPDERAVATQRRIAAHLDKLRRSRRSDGTLRRLYELTSLIAVTSDEHWPRLAGWEHELRRETLAHRAWTCRPPTQPAQAAIVVLEAWRAIESPDRAERLVHEGWDRIRTHPDTEVRSLEDRWYRLLPKPPITERLTAERPERPSRQTLTRLRSELRRLATAHGLQPRHVPDWVLLPDERFAPSPGQWPLRAELARVTRHVLGGDRNGVLKMPGGRYRMPFSRWVAEDRGIRPGLARAISDQARTLVDDGLIDYAERRQYLAASHHLLGRLRTAAPGLDLGDNALRAWVWVMLTHGPAATRAETDLAVETDARLDPEQRLALRDAALDHLTQITETGATESCPLPLSPTVLREGA